MILVNNKWLKWIVSIALTIIATYLSTKLYDFTFFKNADPWIMYKLDSHHYTVSYPLVTLLLQGVPTFLLSFFLIWKLETKVSLKLALDPKLLTMVILALVVPSIYFLYNYLSSIFLLNAKSFPYPTSYVVANQIVEMLKAEYKSMIIWWGVIFDIIFWFNLYVLLNLIFGKRHDHN